MEKSNHHKRCFQIIFWIIVVGIIIVATYLTFFSFPKNPGIKITKPAQNFYFKNTTFTNASHFVSRLFQKEVEDEDEDEESPEQLCVVKEVIDGDTFKLANDQSVRLIGIDTPEINQPYYNEAKNYLNYLIAGKEVMLEKDISEKDKYGRLLRYVWLPQGDNSYLFINLEMVRVGFAYAWSYPPDVRYEQLLKSAQQEAQVSKRGLWK